MFMNFCWTSEIYKNFEHFEKKDNPIADVFPKLKKAEDLVS